MSQDTLERVAADILIAFINSDIIHGSDNNKETAEELAETFKTIHSAVRECYLKKE